MTLSLAAARDALSRGLFADTARPEKPRAHFGLDMLSDWLPYRVYDEGAKLYRNARSKGFVLEVTPLIGADERTGEILGQFFSEGLPQGACLQVLNFASPRIGSVVGPWFAPRYEQGGIYEAIARARTRRLYDLVWSSGSAHAPFHARNVRLIVSLGVPVPGSVTDAELSECREGLMGMLHSLGLHTQELRPGGLLALIDELTSPTTAHETDIHAWNPHDTLQSQAIRRDIELEVGDDRLILRTERFRETGRDEEGNPEVGECYPDHFDVRHYAVRSTPERWAPWECARLIGDMFTDKLRFPCPTATMLCLVYPDQEAASARAGFKFMRTTSLSQTKSARFLPKLAEQSAEWRHVQAELQAGKKLVKLFYGLTSISPLGQGDAHERIIKAIYKAAGWDLADERFLQLQGLVAAAPGQRRHGLRFGQIQWPGSTVRGQLQQRQIVVESDSTITRVYPHRRDRQAFRRVGRRPIQAPQGHKQLPRLQGGATGGHHAVRRRQHPAGCDQGATTECGAIGRISGSTDFHFGHPRPDCCYVLSPDDPRLSVKRRYRLSQTHPQHQGEHQTIHKITFR